MLSPEITRALALMADCYVPTLLLLTLVKTALAWRKGERFYGLGFVYAVATVYGWMWVDKSTSLWIGQGLDYSTHTAAALVLVILLATDKSIGYKIVLAGSLILYGLLMFLLHYHTWSDMLITALVISVCFLPLFMLPNAIRKKLRK